MSLILIFSKARKKRAVSHKSSTATLSIKARCCGLGVSLFLFYNELPGLLMLTKRKGFFCLHLEAEKNLNSTGPTRVRLSSLRHPTWVELRWECVCPLGLLKIPPVINTATQKTNSWVLQGHGQNKSPSQHFPNASVICELRPPRQQPCHLLTRLLFWDLFLGRKQ